jgi:putative oxidoreductase
MDCIDAYFYCVIAILKCVHGNCKPRRKAGSTASFKHIQLMLSRRTIMPTQALSPTQYQTAVAVRDTGSSVQTQAVGIALLRVALGIMWIAHAGLKYFVFTLPGTVQFFDSVGLPGALAYPVFGAELVGGIALVAGIYARQVSLLLVPVMLGAASVHIGNGWVFSAPGGGWEYPIFLTVASIALWLIGDGAYALKQSNRFVP